MKLGIKVGPQPQSFHDLEQTRAPYCEVWFNINEASQYDDLFAFITKRDIDVGLHFWGQLANGTAPNFAYPDTQLIRGSLVLIQKTIDIAAQNKFSYVNIHPGMATKSKIDFTKHQLQPMTPPVDFALSEQLFLEHAQTLHQYATNRGIVLTIETVPQRNTPDWYDHNARKENRTINAYELPVAMLTKAAGQGLWIANDLCHTAANVISDNRTDVANVVFETTKTLAPQTRLIHVGFLIPPYNGTDFHDHLDNPLLNTDQAIPNKKELKQLLKLFANRDDVWAIVEPVADHPKNFFLLQQLIKM
ncbi:hypothetical protein HYV22_01260 [Candidatus Gottesmanbacteria bacterium]|nr:hypothetical protein [Candidatus Gottesmanbacteria bacterium]